MAVTQQAVVGLRQLRDDRVENARRPALTASNSSAWWLSRHPPGVTRTFSLS